MRYDLDDYMYYKYKDYVSNKTRIKYWPSRDQSGRFYDFLT